MQVIISMCYKIIRSMTRKAFAVLGFIGVHIVFYLNNVKFSTVSSNGIPFVSVARGAIFRIGSCFRMNNRENGNPIGRFSHCSFFVDRGACLHIGNNVRMSGAAIVAQCKVEIHDGVMIGGGCCIYDTDFHSMAEEFRRNSKLDKAHTSKKPVSIGENVFLGAHSTILKGVSIGENSVIGACSVVTKNIPPNQVWAGNPARFVRDLLI